MEWDFDDLTDAQGYSGDNIYADVDQQPFSVTLDFEKLCPVTSSPKVGDIVAYRLIELFSSWSPELSSFSTSPEYPIELGDANDADAANSTSLYKEDKSLETDFATLVDVHFVLEEKTITKSANKNGKVGLESDPVEELRKALDAKKVQLSQGQSAEKNWTNRLWSCRGLRGSALGPTIALLRAQNNL